jgi:hypothetical protein
LQISEAPRSVDRESVTSSDDGQIPPELVDADPETSTDVHDESIATAHREQERRYCIADEHEVALLLAVAEDGRGFAAR